MAIKAKNVYTLNIVTNRRGQIMDFNVSDRINQGREMIAGIGPSKLAIGGVILAISTAFLLFGLFYKSEVPYNVLYSQLSPEDAGAITTELKSQNAPYKLSADGTVIEMPTDQVAATRIDLASKGLPAKSNVGFEIFDTQKLGITDMVQKTNLMRAVTGELERTIGSIPAIEMARVHLSVPQETLFIEDQKKPTASVAVKLRRGEALTKPQVMGIVNLVTSAVNGLSPDSVSIIDFEGGLIWSKESNKPGFLNDDQMRQKTLYEDNIKRRIQAMMEKVVGYDKAITTVNADLEHTEVVTNEDIYDPERTAIRSEQKIAEKQLGQGRNNSGIPNATYELGTANRQNSNQGITEEQYSRTEETNNYEVTNIKRQTIAAAGDLKKISVAVILDGQYIKNEVGDLVFSPLPQELLKQLEATIKSTVGFDPSRGDMISLTSVQFARPEEINVWALFARDLAREFARPFLNLILIVLFFFLVVRPLMNWLKKEVEPAGSGAESAVLPEYPGGGPTLGDHSLPLPNIMPAATQEDDIIAESPDKAMVESPANMDIEAPNYDDEEEDAVEEDLSPKVLAYGNLSREDILPLARENIDRTVNLVRNWIEEKPASSDEQKL